MIDFVPFLILAFASYRLTRFFIFDTLIAHSRQNLYVWLANRSNSENRLVALLGHKALEGLSCSFCLGVWITAGVYWLYTAVPPQEWGRSGWLAVAGLAGAQSLLHVIEPDGDE